MSHTDEILEELKKQRKYAIKLLCDCDYTPTAAANLANYFCILTTQPSARQEQVIAAVTKIIRGEERIATKVTPVSLGRRPKGV